MKILRLGSSNDVLADVPEGARAPAVCDRILERELGVSVETVVRATWPTAQLPALVEGWMERYQPDIVIMRITPYWYTYESVPVRVRRKGGRAGGWAADLGLRAAGKPLLGYSRAFDLLRRASYRFIGGDTNFTTTEVIERASTCIRRIVSQEGVVLVVRGCDGARPFERMYHKRSWRRRREVDGAIGALCRELHVPFISNMDETITEDETFDGVHLQRAGQERVGQEEAAVILAAIREAGLVATAPSPAARD